MLQQAITILLVAACLIWLGLYVYRFFSPKKGAGCAGGCGCGHENPSTNAEPRPTAHEPRTTMVSSDDLRNRLKARRG